MQEWGQELQRYYCSKDPSPSIAKAASLCPDSDLREFLLGLPATNKTSVRSGRRLAEKIESHGMPAEATILRLILLKHELAKAGPHWPRKKQAKTAKQLQTLIAACRSEPRLLPSLAIASALAAEFYRASQNPAHEQASQEDARDARRKLSKTAPELYERDLAATLFNLGIIYRDTGDYSGSFRTYQEALTIRERYALNGAKNDQYELSMTLNNLGNLQGFMGDTEAAQSSTKRASAICRELAIQSPKTYRADFAMTLTSLGSIFYGKREFGLASDAFEEARALYQLIDNTGVPDHRSELARTLSNLGGVYGSTNDFERALEVFTQACAIRRDLAASGTAESNDQLAATLNGIATLHFLQRDYETALTFYEEALVLRQQLSLDSPVKYSAPLASLQKNLGVLHLRMRNYSAAFDMQSQACAVYRKLSEAEPKIYQKELGDVLANLGNFYRGMRNYNAATATHLEAVEIRQALAERAPGSHNYSLAMTYNALGVLYHETRRFVEARSVYEQAMAIREDFAAKDPATYEPDLAMTLNNLGVLYRILGDFEKARAAHDRALSIRRKLVKSNRQAHENDLAEVLVNSANLFREVGDHEATISTLKEVCEIRTRLAQAAPKTDNPKLARALSNLGLAYRQAKDLDAALEAQNQALAILQSIHPENPGAIQHDLAVVFNNLGIIQRDRKDLKAARESFENAVRCAEADTFSAEEMHLVKGKVLSAYQYLLSDARSNPAQAFAYAAAMRSSGVRSADIGTDDLCEVQAFLANLDQGSDSPNMLLVPTTGGHPDRLTLGLITAVDCQWWSLPCEGWSLLLAQDPNTSDHTARNLLARRIWNDLPAQLQKVLSASIGNAGEIYISGDTDWAAFPWELLRFGEEEDDFLGLHKALPRIKSIDATFLKILMSNVKIGARSKEVAVIAPHTTGKERLWGVLREVKYLEQRIPEMGGELTFCETGQAANEDLMKRAILSDPAILYFSGHADIVDREEVLILHSTEQLADKAYDNIAYFGRHQLAELAAEKAGGPLFQNAPLIILNSCYSGRTRGHGGRREDLVQAFLDHGAGAVIASTLPMQDSLGPALSQAMFSERTLSKSSIGDQVIELRRQVKASLGDTRDGQVWGAWAMIHLHGGAGVATPI